MLADLSSLGKLLLIIYVWLLTGFCLFFISTSCIIYKKLKNFENICKTQKNMVIRKLVPVILECSGYNKKFQSIFNLKNTSLRNFLTSSFPLIHSFVTLVWNLKLGITFTKAVIKKLLGPVTKEAA